MNGMNVDKYIMAEYPKLLDNAKRICKNPDISQEILQMCLLSFCELSEDRQQQIIEGGKMEHFITGLLFLIWSIKPMHWENG